LLIDLKNTFYEFGTLFHCFNDRSLIALSELKMSSFGSYASANTRKVSINCAINCTLLKAVPNVLHFLNVVNSWLVHALLYKAVS